MAQWVTICISTKYTTQPNTIVISSDTSMQQLPPPSGYAPTPATGYMKPDVNPPPAQI